MATADQVDIQEPLENEKDLGTGTQADYKKWSTELALAEKRDKTWVDRAELVVKRYRDERKSANAEKTQMNILWSNTETIKPSLYSQTPKAEIHKRYKKDNPVATSVATVLEYATEYAIECSDFDDVMDSVVEDFQLPGRAVARILYKPKMKKVRVPAQPISYEEEFEPNFADPNNPIRKQGAPIYGEGVEQDAEGAFTMEDRVEYEDVEPQYVFWKDFRMGKARRWKQVPWVAFRAYLTRKELHQRFNASLGADEVKRIPLDVIPEGIGEDADKDSGSSILKKAEVWEIWDKTGNKVIWLCPGYKHGVLDKKDPHLKLRNFFPCTRPLIMGKTNDCMEPVPEYTQYQDQARELDRLTARIDLLVQAVRVVGGYDANAAALANLLNDDSENKLYPINNWANFSEKGGFSGAIAWLDLKPIIVSLRELYIARDSVKQTLYEITGIADIIRGASDPNETAAAQKIKGRFASQRLRRKQSMVNEFARQLIALMAEVIAENFAPETIQTITGEEIQDEMLQMMRSDPMRTFNVKIETNATIAADEAEEKQQRTEFANAMGVMLKGALELGAMNPILAPLLSEMIMFTMRGYNAGRELEQQFKTTMEQLVKMSDKQFQDAMDPNNKKPSPEQEKLQIERQKADVKIETDREQARLDAEQKSQQALFEQRRFDAEMDRERARFEQEQRQRQEKHELEMEILREKRRMMHESSETESDKED